MASSSSSPDFSDICLKNGCYDVFLSFRGEDTRRGFTHNLYYSLMENKVHTFMDIKLVGKTINSLFKIIGKSKMAVIVYSQNFASSDWCLKELDMILQLMNDEKMTVLPIFYKVNASELKHLNGNTGKCLEELISKHGEDNVKKWKTAITTLGNISGISFGDSSYERDFIAEVIKKVKEMIPVGSSLKPLYSDPASMSLSSLNFSGPCPENGCFDVFLCYRVPDTRKDFTSNLYRSLMDKEFYTFMETEYVVGEVIDSSYEVIFNRAKMAIVVYSESFAYSRWCLRELDMILQLVKDKKMIVLPIFYKVKVNELKHLTGNTGKYLEELISDHGETTVKKWKTAVTTLGHVNGLIYEDSYEHVFIAGIVKKVKDMLEELEETVGTASLSSSSSSPDFSGPRPENGRFDVFLCYRVPDTRKSFTTNLYHSLMENKVHTFMEPEYVVGEVIESPYDIIFNRAKMAVVVYSKSFAYSRWCLKELDMILQLVKDEKMMVLPVFYKVKVDELKHLTGNTGEYLEELISEHGETTVKKWKTAVTTLGHVNGISYGSDRLVCTSSTPSTSSRVFYGESYEHVFIAEVVKKVKDMLEELEETEGTASMSSSSSSPDFSGPCPENGCFDVFLCYRVPDTGKSFTTNLYHSLMENKVHTFMETEYVVGEVIDSPYDIIFNRAKMAVVVYSESFAYSRWCLKELDMILQLVKDEKMMVLPVFYKVKADELKHLTGNTGKYLEKLISEHGETTVKKWKTHVTTLGHVNGLTYEDSYERDFITKVIEMVGSSLKPHSSGPASMEPHNETEPVVDFIRGRFEEMSTIQKRLNENKESTRTQQAHVSAKEENTQALAVQTDVTDVDDVVKF